MYLRIKANRSQKVTSNLFRLLTFDFVNSFLTYIVWSSPFNSSEAAITKPFIGKAPFPAEPVALAAQPEPSFRSPESPWRWGQQTETEMIG